MVVMNGDEWNFRPVIRGQWWIFQPGLITGG
jgi:hypothetical protein